LFLAALAKWWIWIGLILRFLQKPKRLYKINSIDRIALIEWKSCGLLGGVWIARRLK
jgi:hypothetical protein